MDIERELHAIAGENMATQFVFTQILFRISKLSPDLSLAIRQGFDDAANIAERWTFKLGTAAPSEHTVKTLKIIEEMRTVVFGNQGEPKHAV